MMTIAELQRALDRALQEGLLGRDTDAKAGFQALAQLLADYPDLRADEFCAKARAGLQKKSKAKKAARTPTAKTARTAKTASINELAIGRYVGELEQTKTDSRQFETVVGRMKKDREVKVGEAREIAKRFTGSSQSFTTKPQAAKAILQHQIADLRTAAKAGHIADIF
jgi:hypothetical protein